MLFDHEEYHKFHDYQGPQGLALCLVRLALYAYFIYGLFCSYNEVFGESEMGSMAVNQDEYKKYLGMLFVSGSAYFLALPICVYIANEIVESFSQQYFIIVSTHVIQLATISFVIYLFSSKSSIFFKLSFRKTKYTSKSAVNLAEDKF